VSAPVRRHFLTKGVHRRRRENWVEGSDSGRTLRNCERTVDLLLKFREKARPQAKQDLFRTQMVISALTGFVAGWLHVLSGPGHLTAVAPIAINDHRKAWVTGLNWGLGHASGGVGLKHLCIFRPQDFFRRQ
jgi:hypothetical protein